ncbi:ATP-binding protein [Winogradskyella sediminis]|uniref:ATP-binding protein n=1 Tax=Winogradskyella sediminis TaxID=1382466 RepID=UPI003AA7CF68
MSKIPFKVSARTAKLIGLENFSNEEGAIIELVKNTYDADSANCILLFDLVYTETIGKEGEKIFQTDKQNSKIYIIDNGVGMTKDIISNQWMTIGTDDKLYQHLSDNGRVKTGAKGIGRFALNRLGLITELLTISKKTNEGLFWKVNWSDFDQTGTTVSEVEADLESIDNLNLKTEILNRFSDNERLLKLLNESSFNTGTIIEISELNDNWESSQLNDLFSNLEMLLPPKEQSDFEIHLFSNTDSENFGKVKTAYYDDYDYKVQAKYKGNEDGNVEVIISRNELDIESIENRYSEVFDFDAMKKHPYRLEDFRKKSITITKPLSSILSKDVDSNLISKVGKFNFSFYFLKNTISDDKQDGDLKKYPYKSFSSASRKAWLKRFGGVKIFRDDFRIRPYGENGQDWLKLGERQSQSPGGAGQRLGGYRIRPNQIAGTINISRLDNLSFQDKSGREGIIENDVFLLFENIIKEIISFFEKDRNTIMYHFSELNKKKNKEAEAKRKAQEEAERIRKEKEEKENKQEGEQSTDSSSSTNTEETLAEGVEILTRELDEKDEEIRLLRNLASVGLIISSFAHEVKSLRSRLIPRTSFLLRELKNHLNEKELEKLLDKDDNPFYMIKLIQEEDTKLKHWLEYSLNTLKRDKRERTNLNFGDYFEKFKSTWSKALEQRNIKISLKGNNDSANVIRAFEVDMDSIFNNLLSNSMNYLKGIKGKQKLIEIEWEKIGDNIEIKFSDNGKGLDEQYVDNPEEIFKLLESSKKDIKGDTIGTGLGLYIVKSIIEEYNNSSISIIGIKEGLKHKITFKTR